MNKRIRKKVLRRNNKKLIERYPFLIPRNAWTGKIVDNYDHEYTELDEMPMGWRRAFGLMMIEEIREELIKHDFLYKYRIMQIKEKYGSLRWYDAGYPADSKIHDIIAKYERISEHVCIVCGKPDVPMIKSGWISPYCKKCWRGKGNYNELTEKSNKTIQDSYMYSTWNKDEQKWEKVTVNIKDTVEKIRYNYNKKRRRNA